MHILIISNLVLERVSAKQFSLLITKFFPLWDKWIFASSTNKRFLVRLILLNGATAHDAAQEKTRCKSKPAYTLQCHDNMYFFL